VTGTHSRRSARPWFARPLRLPGLERPPGETATTDCPRGPREGLSSTRCFPWCQRTGRWSRRSRQLEAPQASVGRAGACAGGKRNGTRRARAPSSRGSPHSEHACPSPSPPRRYASENPSARPPIRGSKPTSRAARKCPQWAPCCRQGRAPERRGHPHRNVHGGLSTPSSRHPGPSSPTSRCTRVCRRWSPRSPALRLPSRPTP